MPIPILKGCWSLVKWLFCGAPRYNIGDDKTGEWWLSRREVAGLIWRSETTIACSRMGDVFTLQEVLDDIRETTR